MPRAKRTREMMVVVFIQSILFLSFYRFEGSFRVSRNGLAADRGPSASTQIACSTLLVTPPEGESLANFPLSGLMR